MKQKPRIGITGPDHGGLAAWYFTALAILMQGGCPVRITPNRKFDIVKINGLIIGGGADIAPEHYQSVENDFEQPAEEDDSIFLRLLMFIVYPLIYFARRILSTKQANTLDYKRDAFEIGLLKQATERKLPVLGICRGAQIINIYFGGSLHEDISEFYSERPLPRSVFPTKEIFIEENSHLATALKNKHCRVNSLHHQAMKKISEGLWVTAEEDNTIVQAIEHRDYPFMLGVQWHPEYLLLDSRQRQLFFYFVERACNWSLNS
jgi:putative glutamine amidotransferase